MNTMDLNVLGLAAGAGEYVVPAVCCYAVEAKMPWEEYIFSYWPSDLPDIEPQLLPEESLFFLRQCFLACEHLTEVQHGNVDTIEYAGVHNGRHVWTART